MNGRICSHCAKHTHFSHPVSRSFTFHPHTHTHARVSLARHTPLYACFSHFPSPQPCPSPHGIWRSLVLAELQVSRRRGEWEGRVTGCNLWESGRASDCIAAASTCSRGSCLRRRVSWKYHSMHNQRVSVTIRYSPVYSCVSWAGLLFDSRRRTVIAVCIMCSDIYLCVCSC